MNTDVMVNIIFVIFECFVDGGFGGFVDVFAELAKLLECVLQVWIRRPSRKCVLEMRPPIAIDLDLILLEVIQFLFPMFSEYLRLNASPFNRRSPSRILGSSSLLILELFILPTSA